MPEKLVRDRIPEIISEAGAHPRFRAAPQAERLMWLMRKLSEEASELEAAPSINECADVWEVLLAIAAELGHKKEELFAVAETKAKERGGFGKGYLLTLAGGSST